MSRTVHLRLVVIILLMLFGVLKFNSLETDIDNYFINGRSADNLGKQLRKALSELPVNTSSWWLEEQRSRQEHVSSTCQKMKNFRSLSELVLAKKRKYLSHLIVDDKHKTLYCYIPKVACSNWKKLFLILTGRTKATDPKDISGSVAHKTKLRKLDDSSYTTYDIRWRLETYTKFMFVRDPMERLVSAFRNKLEGSNPQFKNIATYILNHYKPLDGQDPSNITFSQFMRYIINTKLRYKLDLNEHWTPFYELCHPCAIQYDFIGKYETLNEDAEHILEYMEVSKDVVQFPPFKASSTKSSLTDYTNTLLPSEQEDFIRIYGSDYMIFGYNIPNVRNITFR